MMIRLELLTPEGDLFDSDTYNKLFTMHGVVMVFFFLIPSIPATLGQLPDSDHDRREGPGVSAHQPAELVPLRHRRRSSRWPSSPAAASTPAGRSTRRTARRLATSVTLAAVGVFIAGFSSILTGFNFIVTIHRMRAPGLTWFRLPLFVWAHYATSLVMILGTPVIAITLTLVAAERALRPRHLRPDARRRPGALPAPVLVLLAPGRLHHDPAGHGRHQRAGRRLLAQADLRLQLRRVLEPRDRRPRLPRLGPPPVRQQPVDLRRAWSSRSSPCSSPCRRP